MDEWIPCKEKNPDVPGRYLTTQIALGVRQVNFADWLGTRWAVHRIVKVIAWKVPEAYREDLSDG